MKAQGATLRARLYVASILVLAAGLSCAAAVYFGAEDGPAPGTGYLIVEGKAYPIEASETKTYVRDLRRFGGKAAVLFDEFNRWFAGLWHGKALGVTIAWITVGIALSLLLIAFISARRDDSRL